MGKKRVGIRVDGNEVIATGHVMRCLAIADALKEKGIDLFFISADTSSELVIRQNGFEFLSLDSDWRHMDGEIEKLQNIIVKYRIEVLLIDSYYVSKSYMKKIHDSTKTIYIDDFGNDIFDVDAVVCYANYYEGLALKDKYPLNVKLFQGVEYTPLRNVFSNMPQKKISNEIKELLVLSGGTDHYNFLRNLSKKILENSLFGMIERVNIICGKYYVNYDRLLKEFEGVRQFHFHNAVNNIENYMLSTDVAISAAGVTAYELCSVGVPTITYIMADNQYENAKSFYVESLMEYAGDIRCDSVLDNIMELLQGKYQDLEYRKKVSENMRKKIDGKGAQRIAKEICSMFNKNKDINRVL